MFAGKFAAAAAGKDVFKLTALTSKYQFTLFEINRDGTVFYTIDSYTQTVTIPIFLNFILKFFLIV